MPVTGQNIDNPMPLPTAVRWPHPDRKAAREVAKDTESRELSPSYGQLAPAAANFAVHMNAQWNAAETNILCEPSADLVVPEAHADATDQSCPAQISL